MKITTILFIFCSIAFADIESIKENVKILSSEEFGGRKPGTPEIDKAAEFIKNKFDESGLEPLGENWYQEFTVKSGKKLEGENLLSFQIYIPRPGIPKDRLRPRTAAWKKLEEWTPMPFSADGVYSGEMVFVGYGISSESLGYDDYAGIDANGKAVVMLTDSPDGKSRTGKFARYASLRYKISNAKDHDAAAVIFIKSQGDSANVLYKLNSEDRLNTNAGLPTIQVGRDKFGKYFPKGKDLLTLEQKINKEKKPASFQFKNKELDLKVDITDIEFPAKNVIGVLKGNSDKYIFLGAHYDHLGVSNSGSSRYRGSQPKMHPGADDNASGVAALIEIAEIMKEKDTQHSVIFAAWSAEEMGLLGSENYVSEHFNVKENVKAYLNYDMVGRLRENKLTILGVGSSPEFKPTIEKVNADFNLELNLIESGMGPSDHSSFYKSEKPVLAFFSGIHSDYHTPEDTPDKINYDGIDLIVNFSLGIFESLDKKDDIAYTEVKMNEKAQKIRRGGSKVVMGVIPNYSDIDHGFIIDGVSPGGPAALAGMKGGDIIVEVAGDKVNDIYDFMYAYWDKQPGDEIIVKVLRDNKKAPISLKVKLAAKD